MKKRIEWLDALRGFTMLLVVYSHVEFLGGYGILAKIVHPNTFNAFFVLFRMPLFFTISVFLFYKERVWDMKIWKDLLWSKFKVQIFPTLIFLGLYCFVFDLFFCEQFFTQSKSGYWFTYTLFIFFFLYSTIELLLYRLSKYISAIKLYDDIILLLFAFLLCAAQFLPLLGVSPYLSATLSTEHLGYFLFFCLGTLLHKYKAIIPQLLEKEYLYGIGMFFLVFVILYYFKSDLLHSFPFYFVCPSFLGLMLVPYILSIFRHYKDFFSCQTRIGSVLQFVGKRTLDIYLLHYFFLPYNLQIIGSWLQDNHNPTLGLFISMLISSWVLLLSIIASCIIRSSSLLTRVLFGVKTKFQ